MYHSRIVASVAALCLAACSGGGGSMGGPPPAPPAAPPAGKGHTALLTFNLTIPVKRRAASHTRRPRYISPNTQSMTVTVNGGTPQPIGLTPTSNPNCTGNGTSTPIVCTHLTVKAAAGSDTFTFKLYEQPLSGGKVPAGATLLSSYTTPAPFTIVAGVTNSLGTFTLNPVLGSLKIAVALPVGGFVAGAASNGVPITLTAKDPSGATIIAPGTYVDSNGNPAPVTLSTNQTTAPFSSAFTFAVNGGTPHGNGTVDGPSDVATLDFTGLTVPATLVTAASGSISATAHVAAIQGAPLVTAVCNDPVDVCTDGSFGGNGSIQFTAVGDTATLTPSEAGWTNAPYAQSFTLQSDTCNPTDDPTAGGNWATLSPGVGQNAASFTLTAQNAGVTGNTANCVAVLADGTGQTVTMTVEVTLGGIGINTRRR
jgi:hypothetical protein